MVLLTSQLQLPSTSAFDDFLASYSRPQWWAVVYAAQAAQHLGYPVIREYGDLVDIPEGTVTLALKTRPQVGNEDLRSLEEASWLTAAFELVLVAEVLEIAG